MGGAVDGIGRVIITNADLVGKVLGAVKVLVLEHSLD
jgi:hypothetical protein